MVKKKPKIREKNQRCQLGLKSIKLIDGGNNINKYLLILQITIILLLAGFSGCLETNQSDNISSLNVETALIDSTMSEVSFLLRWIEGSDFNLTLRSPNGSIINPDIAIDDPNVTFSSTFTYDLYTIIEPIPGEWELIIKEISKPFGAMYIYSVTADTDLTIIMYLNEETGYMPIIISPGGQIKVIVNLSNDSSYINGANVIAIINTPIDTKELVLFDDGMHDDEVAADGVYTNYFTDTNVEGYYYFIARAIGTMNGEQFARETRKRIVTVTNTSAVGPIKPELDGPTQIYKDTEYRYTAVSTHPTKSNIYYQFDWDDGTNSIWIGPYASGGICSTPHNWSEPSTYIIRVKAKDSWGFTSKWSESLVVIVQ